MALAPYFSKDALAIKHVLKKGDFIQFADLLNKHIIEIAFDSCVFSHEGKCCLDLLLKLVARLYPKIKLTALDNSAENLLINLTLQARKINPQIEISDGTATVSLILGRKSCSDKNQQKIFYLGSDHWTVSLSDNQPLSFGDSLLPFAAGTTACIAAANVFKYVFSNFFRKNVIDKDVKFSLLDAYEFDGQAIDCNDLGLFHLVGVGAIGNGFLWALSKLPGVTGKMIAIDHQKITLSNIQRYVETYSNDKNIKKTIIAIRALKGTSIEVKPHPITWNQFIKQAGYKTEIVLTALDTIYDRIAVQSSLPKIIFNGYTDDGILGVARHLDFAKQACINCMYTPKGITPGKSILIARDLSISEKEIRDLLYLKKNVDERLLRIIATANNVSYDDVKQFIGVKIETFYSEFVCAGLLLQLKGKEIIEKQTVEAPLAFQSALAGILMASDLYLFRAGINPEFNRTHYNPLALIKPCINFTHHTLSKNDNTCICNDSVYRDVYQKKWLSAFKHNQV